MVGSVKQGSPQTAEKETTYAGAFDPALKVAVQVEVRNIGKGADGQDNFAIKTKNGKMIPLEGVHNQADAKKQAQLQIESGKMAANMGNSYAWGLSDFSTDLAKQVADQYLASHPQNPPEASSSTTPATSPNPVIKPEPKITENVTPANATSEASKSQITKKPVQKIDSKQQTTNNSNEQNNVSAEQERQIQMIRTDSRQRQAQFVIDSYNRN
jgi:hypothetical protein